MNRFYWFCALHLRSLTLTVAHTCFVLPFTFSVNRKKKTPKQNRQMTNLVNIIIISSSTNNPLTPDKYIIRPTKIRQLNP